MKKAGCLSQYRKKSMMMKLSTKIASILYEFSSPVVPCLTLSRADEKKR